MKRWIIAGWVSLLVIAVAWVLVIRFTSAEWALENLPRVAEGQSWDTPFGEAKLQEMVVVDEVPSAWGGEPTLPAKGATFVLVTVDISNRVERLLCNMFLMGDGQEWNMAAASASNIDESYLTSCPGDSEDVPLTQTITMGRLFEVPISMLDKVSGVHFGLAQSSESSDLIDFSRPHDEVILSGTVRGR